MTALDNWFTNFQAAEMEFIHPGFTILNYLKAFQCPLFLAGHCPVPAVVKTTIPDVFRHLAWVDSHQTPKQTF